MKRHDAPAPWAKPVLDQSAAHGGATARAAPAILPLRVEGLGFREGGDVLLEGVGFALESGSLTVLLGPNGAGKSLTLRICHGLLAPTAGTVRWLGPRAAKAGEHQAMVFQRPVLLRRSVLGNLTYALSLRGVERSKRREAALEALERTGLTPLAGRPARLLSAGEQQRLVLARAWALRPEVLFLDEPTANLDPAAARSVETLTASIHRTGTTLLMTTHDLAQARRLAQRVLLLHRGRLVEDSPAEAFFANPATEAGRAFLKGELYW